MTKDEVKAFALSDGDDSIVDVVDTGCVFNGYAVYDGVFNEELLGTYFGEPIFFLVKDDIIRYPDDDEYEDVLALVNGVR